MGIELIFAKAAKFESKIAQNAYAHFNVKLLGAIPPHASGVFVNLTTSEHGAWANLGSISGKSLSNTLWRQAAKLVGMGGEECPKNPPAPYHP